MFEELNPNNNAIALSDFKTTISYAELYKRIQHISQAWKIKNVNRILLCSSNSIEWCIYYLTAFLNGITVFVVPTPYSTSLCQDIIETYGIHFIFINDEVIIKENNCTHHKELKGVSTVIFTSGTTGKPKGVMLTQENMVSNIDSINDYIQNDQRDNILIIKPLYHSSTLTGELLMGISTGSTVSIFKGKFFPQKIINLLNNYPITILCGVPSMFASMLACNCNYYGKLRLLSMSGSYAHRKLLQNTLKEFKCDIYHVYGLTEASPRVTCLKPEYLTKKIDSIGKPIKNVRVEICKNNAELTMQAHIIGELVVSGLNVMKGYLNDIYETRNKLRENKLYTGDIGYYDYDGFLYLVGRKDDMICRSGINIYPKQIEDIIIQIEGVDDVFVFGELDYVYSNKLIAYIAINKSIKKEDVLRICDVNKVQPPDEVFFVQSLPKTGLGKIDREKIKQSHKINNIV